MTRTPPMRLAAACLAAFSLTQAHAAKISVLFRFPAKGINADGASPMAGLVAGPDGNLYGTTAEGGDSNCNCGTIFQLAPPAAGQTKWTQTVLYSFQGYPNDGQLPLASLVIDKNGNLYGTTQFGGASQSGTIFMLQNNAGSWTETILHQFAGPDGQLPYSSLTFDSAGNLYGTTSLGGSANEGTLFELQPAGVNSTLTVLHDFAGGKDGGQPYSGVIFDSQGNLYGTTSSDGITDASGGTVYQLTPGGTATVLHSFSDISDRCCKKNGGLFTQDGGFPYGNLALDTAGNIYGTTVFGCTSSQGGALFQLSPPAAGKTKWTETLPHCFVGNSNLNKHVDGSSPMGGVVIDEAGNLYGTTEGGGTTGDGAVYEVSPPAAGKKAWKERLLLSFDSADGGGPFGTLIADTQGNLYGTASFGAPISENSLQIGGVFRITP
jgi:uncharacterized repeat protein (TIGR03803 family)